MEKKEFTGRRRFLKATGTIASAGAVSALAGCTGDGGDGSDGSDGSDGNGDGGDGGDGGSTDTPTSTPEDRGDPSVRDEYDLQQLDYQLEDQLNVFQWADYWPEGTVQTFEDAYGVSVNVSNYASNEEMFNKLKAGGTDQFDVIFPSDYMINILIEQEMIQALDLGKLTHWDNLEDKWIDEAPYDPGSDRYSAPYQWGTSGIGVNENMTPDADPTTWDTLWDDAYGGQITMLNDMRESIGAALKRLGYSLNSQDEDQIEEAKEVLIQQKDLLLTYDSINMAENLINEQASPIHTWSGDAFVAYWELWADGGSPISYQVPEEGGVVWVDTAAVTKDAQNPNAAHAFINYTLNAKVNAMITNYVYYATPNGAAKEFVDEGALNNPAIYPPDEVMANLEFIKNIGQATTIWSDAWTEIQNA